MNDDQLDDLKQFITATVSQQVTHNISELEVRLKERFNKLESEIGELRQEVQDGFAGVGTSIDPLNDQIDNHEKRITKLEHKPA